MRVYLIPVKYACNADCTFCITEIEKIKPGFNAMTGTMKPDSIIDNLKRCADYGVNEVEVTGGGEPYLNKDLDKIVENIRTYIPNSYIKVYTNGFRFREIFFDEINVSRAHYDKDINNDIYRSKEQNDLFESLTYFRKYCNILRWKLPLMTGAIDTPEKLLSLPAMFPMVDKIVGTPLFDKVPLAKDRYVKFAEDIVHNNIKMDKTGDYCGLQPIIAADGVFYKNWDFDTHFDESMVKSWQNFTPIIKN